MKQTREQILAQRQLPSGLNIIPDYLDNRLEWMVGVYIGNCTCLCREIHHDQQIATNLCLKSFFEKYDNGDFKGMVK